MRSEELKKIRKALKLTQEELAAKISYSRSSVSAMELGKKTIPDETKERILGLQKNISKESVIDRIYEKLLNKTDHIIDPTRLEPTIYVGFEAVSKAWFNWIDESASYYEADLHMESVAPGTTEIIPTMTFFNSFSVVYDLALETIIGVRDYGIYGKLKQINCCPGEFMIVERMYPNVNLKDFEESVNRQKAKLLELIKSKSSKRKIIPVLNFRINGKKTNDYLAWDLNNNSKIKIINFKTYHSDYKILDMNNKNITEECEVILLTNDLILQLGLDKYIDSIQYNYIRPGDKWYPRKPWHELSLDDIPFLQKETKLIKDYKEGISVINRCRNRDYDLEGEDARLEASVLELERLIQLGVPISGIKEKMEKINELRQHILVLIIVERVFSDEPIK